MAMRMISVLALLVLAFALGAAQALAAGQTSAKDRAAKYFKEGLAEVENGDYEAAIAALEKAVKDDPKNANAYNFLGFSYRKLGDFDKAFENYERALALEPGHLGANEYIGEAYLETGNLGKAEEHLAVLERLCPEGCEERDDLSQAVAAYKADHGG
jgi:Flp pilus assembly protein TadD